MSEKIPHPDDRKPMPGFCALMSVLCLSTAVALGCIYGPRIEFAPIMLMGVIWGAAAQVIHEMRRLK